MSTRSLSLVLFVSSIFAVCVLPVLSSPSFCHGLDCPTYTVVNTTKNYEVRRYPVSYWVSTAIESMNFSYPTSVGFHRLFDYISGQNVNKQKVEMTAPVQVHVTPGAGPFCDSTYTVSFFVPFALQPSSAPRPTNPDVFLRTEAPHVTFVRTFGGYQTDASILAEATLLAESLRNDNIAFNSTSYAYAGYDAPSRVIDRHNEIWFFAN